MDWKNPYVARLADHNGLIFGSDRLGLSPLQVTQVQDHIGRFPKLYVEFGSGSGGHLISQATIHPDTLCMGFELRFKRVVRTAEKARNLGLQNLIILRARAQDIDSIVAPRSIDGIYINFPDPWERRRWMKHRLINPDFIEVLSQLIKPGGFISYKTDHAEYFGSARQFIIENGKFSITRESENLYSSPLGENQVQSEFEKLFIFKRVPINYLLAELSS